jgi:aspartokinase
MIVLKFGGTSVQNREVIDQALTIAEKQLMRATPPVASAWEDTINRTDRGHSKKRRLGRLKGPPL